jgi:zinc finger protein 830
MIIKTEAAWEGHLGSKGHRANVGRLKELERKEEEKRREKGKRKADDQEDTQMEVSAREHPQPAFFFSFDPRSLFGTRR